MNGNSALSQVAGVPPGAVSRARPRQTSRAGVSLIEMVCVLALASAASVAGLAATRQVRAQRAGREASRLLMHELQNVGRQARSSGASHAVLLTQPVAGQATLRVFVDGNDNGVRVAEVNAGVDPAVGAPRLAFAEGRARLAILRSVPNTDHTETIAAGSTPVRFGIAPFISFSPRGTGPSGSIYIAGPDDEQYAIRVLGTTGRLRLLCLDQGRAQWRGC